MADPLSLTASILAIVTATIQSSKVLYQTIQSFRDHPRSVRQLRDELQALDGVLQSLEASAQPEPSILIPLKLPLEQCTKACEDFHKLIVRCTKHSDRSGSTSFRDWAKLRYMDDDVHGFTAMLAGYKSTIAIALADANLRSSTVTLQVLNEYKEMIRMTKSDLEDHLQEITSKLQTLSGLSIEPSGLESADIERFRNECETATQCLDICTQALSHINGLRLMPLIKEGSSHADQSIGLSTRDFTRAHIITLSTMKDCCDKLSDTLVQLRSLEQYSKGQLLNPEAINRREHSPSPEVQGLAREFDTARQCLNICTHASERVDSGKVHVLEDITIGKNGQQMLVATLGELFDARRVTLDEGAVQVVASSCSNASLQDFFKLQHK